MPDRGNSSAGRCTAMSDSFSIGRDHLIDPFPAVHTAPRLRGTFPVHLDRQTVGETRHHESMTTATDPLLRCIRPGQSVMRRHGISPPIPVHVPVHATGKTARPSSLFSSPRRVRNMREARFCDRILDSTASMVLKRKPMGAFNLLGNDLGHPRTLPGGERMNC